MDNWIPVLKYSFIYKGLLLDHTRKLVILDPGVVEFDHLPKFLAMVTVDNVTYKSDVLSHTAKEAEQAAARVALNEIYREANKPLNLAQLVLDTGLCKSMLQEYAHRARIPPPVYEFRHVHIERHLPHYVCTVTVGGVAYHGHPPKNKKVASKNAAFIACATIMATISAAIAAMEMLNAAH